MDSDRHFRNTTSSTATASASSELFICFTSRFSSSSSSSMKISSKSILSPGRPREPAQISLSTSLSRRLKSSGSLKGGQASPMFPTGGKKRGCAFENPEPSSPKVTCIGQVRVKTKKQGKKMRARSLKRRSNSEASFRKSESVQVQSQMNGNDFVNQSSHLNHHLLRQNSNGGNGFQQECLSHRNQRWVHLPFTICEALRAFGAELNCFLPCHSSCSSNRENNKESKTTERSSESESSCGTVFARWLVAVQDNDGRGREIELVVGDEESRTEKENGSQRRHVFEGLDFKEEKEVVQEEESRISICIPPKNALLLMRCRSDPVKMAELAKRFCESPVPKLEEEDEEENDEENSNQNEAQKGTPLPVLMPLTVTLIKEEEEEETKVELNSKLKNEEEMIEESVSDAEEEEEEANVVLQEEEEEEEDNGEESIEMATENEIDVQKLDITVINHQDQEEAEEDKEQEHEQEHRIDQDNQQQKLVEETMAFSIPISTQCEPEMVQDAEKLESAEGDEFKPFHGNEQDFETEEQMKELEEEEKSENGENPTSPPLSVETEVDGNWEEEEENRGRSTEEELKGTAATAMDEGIGPHIQNDDEMGLEEEEDQSKERETPPPEPERETQTQTKPEASVLPDCLLLMMYEPKLSMEVSKETWVCSTDFIRCVPTREKKAAPPPPPKKREIKTAEKNTQTQVAIQPGRWSCSFPAAAAAAAMIEQKLERAKGGGYEPFVLTRCKSEPMRSSAKLAPDTGFCKDRNLEPHRPATFGIGAAGIGF
ncbi:glutamic acid-rich protein-like [Cucurbita moschata]|uniref:Glutamic acid-rich protein-like n=1 Tax=Cucurbita moschata TaxID=3662 RepID=A0A6J1FMZ8_CUCMO|nr:glutamic acid-rich protein-like [Cucurbita moschata]